MKVIRIYSKIFLILFVFILTACGARKDTELVVIEKDKQGAEYVKGNCGWDDILCCHACERLYGYQTIVKCEDEER